MDRRGALGTDELVKAYLTAKRHVVDGGFDHEVAWQFQTAWAPINPGLFVREAAWVVLSAGMSEAVVRRVFPALEDVCHGFDPERIAANQTTVRARCLGVFAHERKIDAILHIARTARALGDARLVQALQDPEPFLRSLPYIGPVTWRHLAKNIGMPVAKADRHMVRFAAAAGRESVDRLCAEISEWLGEPVAVVDVVLWRWSVLHAIDCGRDCGGLPHPPKRGQIAARAVGTTAAVYGLARPGDGAV